MRQPIHLCLSLAVVFTGLAHGQSRSPVVEFTGLMGNVDVNHRDGRWQLHDQTRFTAAFLPAGSAVKAVLYRAGQSTPLYAHDFVTQDFYGVFTVMHCQGLTTDFFFKEAGDYVLSMQANGKEMTRFPFSVMFLQSGDEFDPVRVWFAKGPWDKWGCFYVPLAAGQDAIPEFWIWRALEKVVQRGSDVYRASVKLKGDVIAESVTSHVGNQQLQEVRLTLKFPDAKGGTPIRLKDLLARDGDYQVVVYRNDKPESAFPLHVAGGKLRGHPRQSSSQEPRHQYILPRFPGDDAQRNRAGNVYWTERLPDADVKAAADAASAQVDGPSGDDRRRWFPMPRVDPNRPFELVVTGVETRSDTMLSAGDDIIVFGTGYPKGVKYLKVGEDHAREIPNGEVYSSTVFAACGKKIVLVHGKKVLVFDTETGKTASIAESDISLYDPRGGLHYANSFMPSGMLVATINDVTKVQDQTILKIIDVSGATPRVFPIKNADYTQRDVSCVEIDSKVGIVAVGCRQKKALYAAPIAESANQNKYDLSEYRGVDSNQIHIAGERIIYADEDDKVRELDLESGTTRALTEEAFGRSGNSYIATDKKLVVATAQHIGTRYEMAVSGIGQTPQVVPGSGTKIEGTSGVLGWAGSATITMDGTVFVAGTPSGGVGVGEYLQVLTDDGWIAIRREGKVIGAIDVTCGPALLAFKHGSRALPTTIGYATFGRRIRIPHQSSKSAAPAVATTSPPKKMETKTGGVDDAAAKAIAAQQAENLKVISEALDNVEKTMFEALVRSGKTESQAKAEARAHVNKMRAVQKLPLKPDIK